MKIIGITGRRLSGKNLVADYLSENRGFRILDYTRDVLAPMLRAAHKPVTRQHLAGLATSLREKEGMDTITRRLCGSIRKEGKYVISGIRFREEVKYLRNRFGEGFTLIAVESDSGKRYGRARKRGDKGEGKLTYEEFMDMESLPTERDIQETMKLAEHTLENNGTEQELYIKINKLIDKIRE